MLALSKAMEGWMHEGLVLDEQLSGALSRAEPTADQGANPRLAELQGRIDTIDLSMVKLKLMDQEEGQGWSKAQVDHVEIRYRRYLMMLRLSPFGDAVPTRD